MSGIDLHTHSHFSDGALSPSALLALAGEHQVQMLALTDHDTIDGCAEAQQAAQEQGIRLIVGVEISAMWQPSAGQSTSARSYPVHIVALDPQQPAPLHELLATQQHQRAERALIICERLRQRCQLDILADVRALADGHDDRITRSHIAQVLCQRGVVQRQQQAFDRYLGEGKCAYVPFDGVTLAQAIEVIHAAAGFAVLAHPTRYNLSATRIRQLITDFAQHSGDAIELPPVNEQPATRQMIDRLIAQQGLRVSVGSDFHGPHMAWCKLGQVPVLTAQQQGIWELFASA